MSAIIISGEDFTPQEVFVKKNKGELRQVLKKIYTDDLSSDIKEWVWNNRYRLIARCFPDSVISHRTAFKIGEDAKVIYLTWIKAPVVHQWPGITINCIQGPPPHQEDTVFLGLRVASNSRNVLENLQPSRRSKVDQDFTKCVTREEIEEFLEGILHREKEEGLNKFRDESRRVSLDLNMSAEYELLNEIISSLLKTGPTKSILKRPTAKAYALGIPYDDRRVGLFTSLGMNLLTNHRLRRFPAIFSVPSTIFSFFEAYFSNYIEGTRFEIEEAQDIIFKHVDHPLRVDDSHDILGTYNLLVNEERSIVPQNADDLLEILKRRHRIILSSRLDKHPGEFKQVNNRAGATHFVDWKLVKGTLIKGFEIYKSLPEGFPRAVFLMALISEVHPFDDGNGRLARIMMNAELESIGQCRIIVTTSMRGDYLRNLKGLSNNGLCDGYTRLLYSAQEFSSNIPCDKLDQSIKFLTRSKAFDEEVE
jgi:hypothetical protein